MGKLEIDYNKLHDAFFRWQTKPFMSIHGDLYFEGKVSVLISSLILILTILANNI